jgi:hypothetical protein
VPGPRAMPVVRKIASIFTGRRQVEFERGHRRTANFRRAAKLTVTNLTVTSPKSPEALRIEDSAFWRDESAGVAGLPTPNKPPPVAATFPRPPDPSNPPQGDGNEPRATEAPVLWS